MRLTHLQLENFRKFTQLTLSIDPSHHIICFVGPNTIGKTNILEGIYYTCLLKSFRAVETKDIIHWDHSHLRTEALFTDHLVTHASVSAVLRPKKQKKYMQNHCDIPLSEYVGMLPLVFFSPDDINLLLLSPANRRRYLDILLSQIDTHYLRLLIHYQKVLKQRNALLKSINKKLAKEQELDYWDAELARLGLQITTKRTELLIFFNTLLPAHYTHIAQQEGFFQLHYHPSIKDLHSEEELLLHIKERRARDLILESTSVGPHRDDFSFLLNQRHIESFASRGDTRSMILALKLCEISFIRQMKHMLPILLLDDVFSELDEKRQEELLSAIPEEIQTFITSTTMHIGSLERRKKHIHFIDVENLAHEEYTTYE